jgi:uncharacterized delta-60 repeat protein
VHDYVQGLAIQPDGKLLLCGTGVVIRLLADGTPDPGFGTSGLRPIVTELGATEIAIDGDGRIVVAGGSSQGVGLDRYLPNGRADRSLRAARRNRTLFATGLGIDPIGRLLVTGFEQTEDFVTRYVVGRLHRSGRFDRSFGKRGLAVTMPSAYDVEDGRWEGNLARVVVTEPDGDVVVGIHQSSGFTLLRYRGSRRAR